MQDSTWTVGRRGVAGNFFVIKAVGAAAEAGADLDELVRIGEKVNSVTRTMGLALTACTPPAKGSPLFELGDDEIEIGVGIHGEPGRRRAKIVPSDELVDILLEPVVADLPYESGDRVALMINGLGGTPISELYVAYGHAHEELEKRGITVARSYVGEYCTSLDMAGASLDPRQAGRRDRGPARGARRGWGADLLADHPSGNQTPARARQPRSMSVRSCSPGSGAVPRRRR